MPVEARLKLAHKDDNCKPPVSMDIYYKVAELMYVNAYMALTWSGQKQSPNEQCHLGERI